MYHKNVISWYRKQIFSSNASKISEDEITLFLEAHITKAIMLLQKNSSLFKRFQQISMISIVVINNTVFHIYKVVYDFYNTTMFNLIDITVWKYMVVFNKM